MFSKPKDIYDIEFFKIMLHELTFKRVQKILGVHERTIYTWLKKERVPRMAMLALFWESSYGRSLVDSSNQYEIHLLNVRIQILEGQIVKAKHIITGLRKFTMGGANEPLFDDLSNFYASAATATTTGEGATTTSQQVA